MQHIPHRLILRLTEAFGEDTVMAIRRGWESDRPCTFRVNTLRSTSETVEKGLHEMGIPFESIGWLPLAYRIDREHEYALKGSPLFRRGHIYVQGFASQIPAHILGLGEGMTVLDMTAAPGSKTTQMAALMGNTGRIYACEKNQIRSDKLAYNLKLQGVKNTEIVKMDGNRLPERFAEGTFDRVLLDAPCSAEGRMDPRVERSYGYWGEDVIARNIEIQKQLIEVALSLLTPDGILVYSTCTLAPEENEGILSGILSWGGCRMEPIGFDIPDARAGLGSFRGEVYNAGVKEAVRILPSDMMEGFFVGRVRKVG